MSDVRAIKRERITWTRWDHETLQFRITHPWMWVYTDTDGTERYFDTRHEAEAFAEEPQDG